MDDWNVGDGTSPENVGQLQCGSLRVCLDSRVSAYDRPGNHTSDTVQEIQGRNIRYLFLKYNDLLGERFNVCEVLFQRW